MNHKNMAANLAPDMGWLWCFLFLSRFLCCLYLRSFELGSIWQKQMGTRNVPRYYTLGGAWTHLKQHNWTHIQMTHAACKFQSRMNYQHKLLGCKKSSTTLFVKSFEWEWLEHPWFLYVFVGTVLDDFPETTNQNFFYKPGTWESRGEIDSESVAKSTSAIRIQTHWYDLRGMALFTPANLGFAS